MIFRAVQRLVLQVHKRYTSGMWRQSVSAGAALVILVSVVSTAASPAVHASAKTFTVAGIIKTGRNPICSMAQTAHCSSAFIDAHSPADSAARPSGPIAQATASRTRRPVCRTTGQTSSGYKQQSLSLLAATNSQVDTLRHSAIVSGESYKIFDAQANALFAAYNAKIQQLYSNYASTVHGCMATIGQPVLFRMFTP